MTRRRPPNLFTRDENTIILVNFLRPRPKGTTIEYTILNDLINQDVQAPSPGYNFLYSARRILRSEDGQVWECVVGVGVHRCTDPEIMALPPRARRRIRRAANLLIKKVHCADLTQLDAAQQAEYRHSMLNAAIVAQFASEKDYERQRIHIEVGGRHPPPPRPEDFRGM
jgi:hypothetical protein